MTSLMYAQTDWYLSLWEWADKLNNNPIPKNQVLTCQTALFSTKWLHNAGYSQAWPPEHSETDAHATE